MDEKTHADDPVNMNASKGQPDGIRSNEMVLTISYVKTEQSAEYEFQASSSKGNEGRHGQSLITTHAIKTDSTEARINNTSGNEVGEEAGTKEILNHDLIEEHGINRTTYISYENYFDDNASSSKGNGGINSTSGNEVNEEAGTKEILNHDLIEEHGINRTAYVSHEYEFDDNDSSSKGNAGPYRQNLIATNAIKRDNIEGFTNRGLWGNSGRGVKPAR